MSALLALLLLMSSFAMLASAETPELTPVESIKITKVPGFENYDLNIWNFGFLSFPVAKQILSLPSNHSKLPDGTTIEVTFTDGTSRTIEIGKNVEFDGWYYTTEDGYALKAGSEQFANPPTEAGFAFKVSLLGQSDEYRVTITEDPLLQTPFFAPFYYVLLSVALKIMDLFM